MGGFLVPMKQYILVVFIAFMLFTSGCLKTPSETMRIPEYSQADIIFNKYKKMLQENKPPKDLLVYLDRNISKLHKNSADIAVIRIIELQKKQQVKYEEKLLDEDYAKQLQDIENIELHDITNPKVKEWVKEVQADGFNISTSSGSPKIEINYEKINKIADEYVTAELKDYIKIESEESSKKYSDQNSLDLYLASANSTIGQYNQDNFRSVISFIKELSHLLDLTFDYTDTYGDSPYKIRVNELKSEYLKTFFFGSPNNSAFTYYQGYDKDDNKIVPEWDRAYKNTKKDYTDGTFAIFVSNYYQDLLKNNKILNKNLYDTINRKINNPE
jgi:Skp family chaperone for outer membrane proteins